MVAPVNGCPAKVAPVNAFGKRINAMVGKPTFILSFSLGMILTALIIAVAFISIYRVINAIKLAKTPRFTGYRGVHHAKCLTGGAQTGQPVLATPLRLPRSLGGLLPPADKFCGVKNGRYLSGVGRCPRLSLNKHLLGSTLMAKTYAEGQTFEKCNFTETPLAKGEYENCTFSQCDFSNADLSGCHFSDCHFTSCNLSMAKLAQTALKEVQFSGCKLLGLRFEACNPFLLAVAFDDCLLNFSSFCQLKLKKTKFKNSALQEVDFTETDLRGASFDQCDLTRAVFERTNLEGADFRTALHYSLDPEVNQLKKAKFSLGGVAGLLAKYGLEITP